MLGSGFCLAALLLAPFLDAQKSLTVIKVDQGSFSQTWNHCSGL
jgi:hypothetical protein